MRGIPSSVTTIRKKVFTEVARLAYDGDYDRMEKLPYIIVPGEEAKYRESIFLERAIAGERVRLAMGLPLRPVDQHTLLSEGINESAIADKYYDPPLINIIQYACHACPTRQYRVTEYCQGCLARSCQQVCPKDAIRFANGKSYSTTPSSSWSGPAPRPAAWEPSAPTSGDGPKSTTTSASPAACAW